MTPLERQLKIKRIQIIAAFNKEDITTFGGYLHYRNDCYYGYPEEQLYNPLNKQQLLKLIDADEWRQQHYQYEYSRNGGQVNQIQEVLPSTNRENEHMSEGNLLIGTEDKRVGHKETEKESKAKDSQAHESSNIGSLYRDDKEHPKQKCRLIQQQRPAAEQLFNGIVRDDKRGQLLLCKTGGGKTYILGAVIRRLLDEPNWLQAKSLAPWKIIYLTKSSIVEQTRRVLQKQYGIDTDNECIVTNFDQLRSNYGNMFIDWQTKVVDNDPSIEPVFKPIVYPCVWIVDECQAVKNEDSLQSKTVQAATEINVKYPKHPVHFIFSSATPFTRVSEAKAFILACNISIDN